MYLERMLEETSDKYPEKMALIYKESNRVYQELNKSISAFGNKLKYLGIEKGDTVTAMLPDMPEFAIYSFASVKPGAVVIVFNFTSMSYELNYPLDNCDAKKSEEIRTNFLHCKHLVINDRLCGDYFIRPAIIAKKGKAEADRQSILRHCQKRSTYTVPRDIEYAASTDNMVI